MTPTPNLRFEVDADGIALITLDVADRPMNVFTPAFSADLRAAVAELTQRADVRGAVITSGKRNGFLAGADLKDFVGFHARGTTAVEAAELIAESAQPLRALERCGKPVAVAVNGLALGGGFELCLACHHRVLVDDPRAVVGLPEVTVGLLPGGGGTQRLPRLIGIERALPLLLTGRHVAPAEALALGLVDAVVPAGELIATARRWVLAQSEAQQPWDMKGYRVPGGTGALAPHANGSFGATVARIRRETQDNYPAPLAILSAVYEGTQLPIELGLRIEAQYFGPLLAGPVARNLMRTLFVNRGAAQKLARRPAGVPRQPVQRLGVLGAGMMGAGIAQVAAAAGIAVVLVDATQAAAEAAKARIAAAYAKEKGADAEQRLARITATADVALLRGSDFVVEAVFEDRAVKAEVMARAALALGDVPADFVWASNTSTLPIDSLAAHWQKPAQLIGVHFFSPVPRMPLVEIILGPQTAPAALARALDFVQQLRKTPIVVHDSPGFFTSRIFCAYVDEGMAMLAEGVAPALIENAARQAGFATGPLAVTDEVSLDLQQQVIDQAKADGLDARFLRGHAQAVVARMNALGRLGRKSGGGFHDFLAEGGKQLWPGLAGEFPIAAVQPAVEELKQRLLGIQALASAQCVEEGVVTEAADADLGSILGLGYPSWTGGTLSYIETVGLRAFVAQSDALAERHGERFRPSAWLRARAEAGQPFHPPAPQAADSRPLKNAS
ncbi:3-hydroxyacyl-CoA dehydrogenase NAD-binding domain-containing protein [Variovorax sp. LT1R16]|uniref:3-hydroxyacyl-CoA dehydrogenase NAD-binding domain-containing protein n=1 Tax=Variovorax sp. LT1R16 TaxID=3443728 RepID=UPI003F46CF35